jgi:hypothetical protein
VTTIFFEEFKILVTTDKSHALLKTDDAVLSKELTDERRLIEVLQKAAKSNRENGKPSEKLQKKAATLKLANRQDRRGRIGRIETLNSRIQRLNSQLKNLNFINKNRVIMLPQIFS